MKILIPFIAFLVSPFSFAAVKSSKVNVTVYTCPKTEESRGCPESEKKLINKDIELVFTPIISKDGVVEKEEVEKHKAFSEKINGMNFVVGNYSGKYFYRNKKIEKLPTGSGVVILNFIMPDNKVLHYSEHVFFTDKTTNFFHTPLRTNDPNFNYFAELRPVK